MTATDSFLMSDQPLPSIFPIVDTHTHFDAPLFDSDRQLQAQEAYENGVHHLALVGYLYRHFDRLYDTQQALDDLSQSVTTENSDQLNLYPRAHIALGLHPFYIEQHTEAHLLAMAQMLTKQRPLAIGEIGLDTYTDAMKQPENFAKQQRFFSAQLDMAVNHQLPVMLHIRKAHAQALALLKAHDYDAHKLGGIAHSFSGGAQEAKAFVKLGFKLGVTGQVTNPNAKKLRYAIQAAVADYGIGCLVIETDCPDMTPTMCQTLDNSSSVSEPSALGSAMLASSVPRHRSHDEWGDRPAHNRNVPANLPWVLLTLSELLTVPPAELARQLWQNSCNALQTTWQYPK
ncbi:TatD DNase family protein [Psychrobacter sp. PL15]|uniref:TatD family hydrolase n=1 Tax=Psychrobacter sp. PL15 TaxID=3071719 RepID=UPI002DFD627C|nr:TatD DNase family protein [Psychrobacter sp. PL15]